MADGRTLLCSFCLNPVQTVALTNPYRTGEAEICVGCGEGCHPSCYREKYKSSPENRWLCDNCLANIFPFGSVISDKEFLEINSPDPQVPIDKRITQLNAGSRLEIASGIDDHPLLNNSDIDPDPNLYAGISWDSPYCTPESISRKLDADNHFNTMH